MDTKAEKPTFSREQIDRLTNIVARIAYRVVKERMGGGGNSGSARGGGNGNGKGKDRGVY